MFYKHTITRIKEAIRRKAPWAKPAFEELQISTPPSFSYLLWMCQELEKMETGSIENAVKAGRWIGWILAHIELEGFWSNAESRDYTREDHLLGLDQPH